jgi:hypothetical protein
VSMIAVPAAEEVIGARAATSAGSKAAGSKAALPRDPGAHAAKLRGQGMDNAKIRKALRDMGYDGATAANVAPGNDSKQTPSSAAAASVDPAAAEPSSPATPAAPPASPGPSFPERFGHKTPSGTPSGLLLGLVLYPVALAFLRGGPAEMKSWFLAKFLNKTTPGPATPGSSGRSGIPKPGAAPAPGSGAGAGRTGFW